jgi:hypothetical protein
MREINRERRVGGVLGITTERAREAVVGGVLGITMTIVFYVTLSKKTRNITLAHVSAASATSPCPKCKNLATFLRLDLSSTQPARVIHYKLLILFSFSFFSFFIFFHYHMFGKWQCWCRLGHSSKSSFGFKNRCEFPHGQRN